MKASNGKKRLRGEDELRGSARWALARKCWAHRNFKIRHTHNVYCDTDSLSTARAHLFDVGNIFAKEDFRRLGRVEQVEVAIAVDGQNECGLLCFCALPDVLPDVTHLSEAVLSEGTRVHVPPVYNARVLLFRALLLTLRAAAV